MADTLDVPASESSPDSLSDSEPETIDDVSCESSGESDSENHRRKRLSSKYVGDKVAEACTTNFIRPHYRKRKKSSLNGSLCKRLHQERDHSSGDSISNATGLASDELPLGEEVKSALKEITSLLNTVVQRVERVESELQRQKSTDPSSSRDVTPTRARVKPPLAVKVCLCYALSIC